MATQSEFINTPVKVLNRSAFNKSHQNLLTMKVGTLTPVLVDELVPDSTIDLRAAALAKLPPLASDTFMRVKMHLEAFFVPYRILYAGYADAMSGQKAGDINTGASAKRAAMPYLRIIGFESAAKYAQYMGPGTLFDYLGFKTPVGNNYPIAGSTPGTTDLFHLNVFPFLAYARIYDDWYRNALVQNPLFRPVSFAGTNGITNAGALPYTRLTTSQDNVPGGSQDPSYGNTVGGMAYGQANPSGSYALTNPWFCDGSHIDTLRQRNFGHDYFTSASLSPTVGAAPVVVAPVSSGNASFTIGALRSANSLTQFAERNALAGVRYSDWLKANYGVDLSEQIEGRAQYLGRMVFDVYSKGVAQSAPSFTDEDSGASTPGDVPTQNPFKTVGAQYGDAVGVGEDTLCQNFYVREPGMLMVIASLVPRVTYSTGAARYLRHYTTSGFRGDLANQLLENVGPQPIYKSELDGNVLYSATPDAVFGYTDRFAEYKTKFDELHGLLRDGESLQAFALQRTVGLSGATLASSFIQIPTNYLDQVSAVQGDISKYGCWMDVAFDYKVVQPISRYSTPSLVMPAEFDGHTETVKRSGTHL